jgi:glycosyltransferase involved in cell wall biosynthesis
MDGGSTDRSVEIIEKYSQWLMRWESAKDRGQSHAINKGFALASGDLWAWVSSSDLYLPGALEAFALLHTRRPDAVILMGACELMYADDRISLQVPQAENFLDFLDLLRNASKPAVYQPAQMWSGQRAREVGRLDEANHMTMDVDFMLRLLDLSRTAACMPNAVARVHFHEGQKSGDGLTAMTALVETQRRHFKRVEHLLPMEEQILIRRNLRTALAQLDLHRFCRSGWTDIAALVRSFARNPQVVMGHTLTILRALRRPGS